MVFQSNLSLEKLHVNIMSCFVMLEWKGWLVYINDSTFSYRADHPMSAFLMFYLESFSTCLVLLLLSKKKRSQELDFLASPLFFGDFSYLFLIMLT